MFDFYGKVSRVALIDPALEAQLESDLRQILLGTLKPVFHFQPIADLRGVVVAGYEALVRLPVRAGLPPDVCLQAAARYGIQMELEAVLVRQALLARQDLPANTFLSINLSPAFLCSPFWERMRSEYHSLAAIVVEITESECITDYTQTRARVGDILARGGLVAIDDAGAGYASLKHVLELRPSFIKLDRALVQDCDKDRAKSTLIQVLGDAASRMDAWVITEGVESAPELAELVRLQVPLAQGYFLGRPQARMESLTSQAAAVLQHLSPHRMEADNLLLYLESCPPAASRAEAEAMLHQGCELVAVVDGWGRPVEMLERNRSGAVRVLPGFLRCPASGDVREVLRRALTREASLRFDPVLLTDGEGRLRGALRLDRLMLAVLEDGAGHRA